MTSPRHLFEVSRNPIEVLLIGGADSPRWFEHHGVSAARAFVRAIRAHPEVRRAELDVAERTGRDMLGRYAWAQAKLDVDLRGNRRFRVDGSGHSSGLAMARVIAFAELLERVSLEIDLAAGAPIDHVTKRVADTTSNGFCFHSSAVRVVKGALCELLERDAFLTRWYAGRALPSREIDRTHPCHALAQRFAAGGWKLREHGWKHDKVDVAIVYLSAVRSQPARDGWNFFLGGGAAATHREAVGKAASELLRMFRMWHAAYNQVDHSGRVSRKALGNVLGRLLVFQRPGYLREFERMTSARPRDDVHRLRARSDRRFVVECMRALGDVKIVPMPVPRPLHPHVFCIKAVSDQLQNLDWYMPPRFNVARIEAAFGPVRRPNRFPHPIA